MSGFLLIVTGLLILFLFIRRAPFGKSNSSFSTDPEKEITKIELSDGINKVVLEKQKETWLVNGRSEARKSGIFFILRILQELKIKSPVSPQLFDNEITKNNIVPVKVKVFERRKLLKSYLVYKTGSNKYGNIMKMKEGSKPFIVYVPGYEGDISSGFIVSQLFWEPYTVFNLLPSEISSVTFENLSDTASSFSIKNIGHQFVLDGQSARHEGWDTSLVVRYISYFAWIPFESWASDITEPVRKEIESSLPIYRITVVTTAGRKIAMSLWQRKIGTGNSETIDSDRLLGKTGERDELFIMRYFDIDPLIKKRSYFFQR